MDLILIQLIKKRITTWGGGNMEYEKVTETMLHQGNLWA